MLKMTWPWWPSTQTGDALITRSRSGSSTVVASAAAAAAVAPSSAATSQKAAEDVALENMQKKETLLDKWRPSRILRYILLQLIRAGPIPRHVAFIMDGNRRFAKKMHVQTQRGHVLGFEKLQETLRWCMDIGVEMVTVYAFSIENFKRSKEEVDALMTLATQKFKKLMEKSDLIQQHNVRVRVLGEITMLPLELQQIIAKAVHMSRNNTRAVLNVCFAYTARQEIVNVANRIATSVDKGELLQSDVSEDLIERSLYTEDAPEPELLVRTSGEVRLSDFLLWQTAYSCLVFTNVLWPEFTFSDLVSCIIRYQRDHAELEVARIAARAKRQQQLLDDDLRVLSARHPSNKSVSPKQAQEELAEIRKERESRVARFLSTLYNERSLYFEKLAMEAD